MKVLLTLETGEHVTGELVAVEVDHAYSANRHIRAYGAEIVALEILEAEGAEA